MRWVRAEARRFFLPGHDADDVLQEALLGLLSASRAWDGSGSFKNFARLCIRRRLSSCVRQALVPSRGYLTNATRDVEKELDWRPEVHELVEQRDDIRRLVHAAKSLNPKQVVALARVLNGVPLQGKADDNHRYEARRRLRAALA